MYIALHLCNVGIYIAIDIGGNIHCNVPMISGQYAQIARENAELQKH